LDEAIECYDKAIELSPTYTNAYYNKSIAVFKMGKTEEAIELLDKVLEIDPDDLDAKLQKVTV